MMITMVMVVYCILVLMVVKCSLEIMVTMTMTIKIKVRTFLLASRWSLASMGVEMMMMFKKIKVNAKL